MTNAGSYFGDHAAYYKCECGKGFIGKSAARDHIQSCSSMPHITSKEEAHNAEWGDEDG